MPEKKFTTSAMVPFQFDTQSVDVRIDSEGNPWWVLQDICAVLGIRDASMAADRLKPSETITTTFTGAFHSELKLLLVNEQGLYRLHVLDSAIAAVLGAPRLQIVPEGKSDGRD